MEEYIFLYKRSTKRRPTGFAMTSKIGYLVLGILILLLIVVPAQADTVYWQGSPELSAYISGVNEFYPGDSVNLTIVVKNTGLNGLKLVQQYTPSQADLPNTAKSLIIGLTPGDVPVAIKSDPQLLGDLTGGSDASGIFTVKINSDAPAGTYLLPLVYNYSYLYAISAYQNNEGYEEQTQQNYYQPVSGTLYLPLTIKPDVSVDVLSVTPENVYAGTEGYLDMAIRNLGSDDGQEAVVRILQNGNSPIQPIDSDVYLGDFPSGGLTSFRYKVAVTKDTQPGVYPVDIEVIYQNARGDFVTSKTETVGVTVGGKADFSVVSEPVVMNPGDKKTVTVTYKNTGDIPVYSAEVRIVAIDPFTTSDDISPLGDLMPGDSASGTFTLTLDRAATVKEYGLDSEVRYRDMINDSYVSDVVPVKIEVVPPSVVGLILSNVPFVFIGLVLVGVLLFRFLRKRRHSQS